MVEARDSSGISKLRTGIDGLDLICNGGLPTGRVTLVSGTSGTAKTVLACQFLASGITKFDQAGVFITFEESVADVRRNMLGFGWDIAGWEEQGKWVFVDASPSPEEPGIISGEYDHGALLARIEYAVRRVGATRVSVDCLGALFTQLQDETVIRSELFRIVSALKKMGVTGMLTGERIDDYGPMTRYGVEEFVADNVIMLRQVLEAERRRRTIEIIKFRGTSHQKGEFPFTIMPETGIVVMALSAMDPEQGSSDVRITSGIADLDDICGGGFFKDSTVLVSGATGTGKTLMGTHFVAGGAANNERSLIFAFEESRGQLYRNARGWGMDLEGLENEGRLRVICDCPEVVSVEDHLAKMKAAIEEFRPNRMSVDSLSALERICSLKAFREFVMGLTYFIKHQEITGLFTVAAPALSAGSSLTEPHIANIADCIIVLRQAEVLGEMQRGLSVLKMRGSAHSRDVRGFTIDSRGMHISNTILPSGT